MPRPVIARDWLIVLLAAATATAIMFFLISLRLVEDRQARIEKLERDLYVTDLKRDYFEWRESNALGHSTASQNFPRWQELQALNNK
jgi:hypothetical protein